MKMQNEPAEFQPGDLVWVGNHLHTVEKITPAGFIKVDGTLYDPATHFPRGKYQPYFAHMIRKATEAEVYKHKQMNTFDDLINLLNRNQDKFNLQQLSQLTSIVKEIVHEH